MIDRIRHDGFGFTRVAVPLLLALGVFAPARAAEAQIAAPMVERSGPLRSGSAVEVRWAIPDPGAEELELLLSVDDGRHYAVRVSPELDGRTDHFEWRVPRLSTARARLRLRMRIDGREVESEPSAAFVIEAPVGEPAELDVVHEDGWWSGVERETPAPLTALAGGERAWLSATDVDMVAEKRPGDPFNSDPALRSAQIVGRAQGQTPRTARTHARSHRTTPLRN